MVVYHELSSIERELGFSAKTLYSVSNNISSHYAKTQIPKRDGGVRTLSVPDAILKSIQRAILEKLLAYEPVSPYAKAYKPASGIKKNAASHVFAKQLLKLDILRFFDNVSYSAVKERVFPAKRYSEKIRILLTMLCYHREALPQGAPTSPAISNIILRDFDMRVGEWCRDRKIVYTRYCDDMSFSGDFDSREVIEFIDAELRLENLTLNRKKTALIPNSKRQTVTGIVVNSGVSAPKEMKREIRQCVYYCERFGTEDHLRHKADCREPLNYLESLLGKINFVLHIEGNNTEFCELKARVCRLIKELKSKEK